jgi:hypothetical protein
MERRTDMDDPRWWRHVNWEAAALGAAVAFAIVVIVIGGFGGWFN